MNGLCDYLGTTYSVTTVASMVKEVRSELGLPVRVHRLSATQTRRRKQIIDEYVAAHPRVSTFDMEKPIAAQLEAELIPPTPPGSLATYISDSRRRLNILSVAHSDMADRKVMIEEFLRQHSGLQSQDTIAPIQQLMQARKMRKLTGSSLLNCIREIKKESRSTTPSPPTTTTIQPNTFGRDAAENAAIAKRQRRGEIHDERMHLAESDRSHRIHGQLAGDVIRADEDARSDKTCRGSRKRQRRGDESDIEQSGDGDDPSLTNHGDDDEEDEGGHADIHDEERMMCHGVGSALGQPALVEGDAAAVPDQSRGAEEDIAADHESEPECGEPGSVDASPGRGRSEILWQTSLRRQWVGEYLMLNQDQRGPALIDGIRGFLITKNISCSRPTIARLIPVARVDVGLPTYQPNLPRALR